MVFLSGLYTLLTQLPTYLKTVLQFDIKQVQFTHAKMFLLRLQNESVRNIDDAMYRTVGSPPFPTS
jgi:hypothetical protein